MAASTSSAREEPTWKDDTPSGFLKLPAEIRNEIYRLVLLTSTTTHVIPSYLPSHVAALIEYMSFCEANLCMVIEDLEPEELQALKEAGRGTTRTTYKPRKLLEIEYDTMSDTEYTKTRGSRTDDLHAWESKMEQRQNSQVSYTLSRSPNQIAPIMNILALNQQTRAEAAAIFYGEIAFYFNGISPLFAFLMDRYDLSLQAMRLPTKSEPPKNMSKTLSLALPRESLDVRIANFKCSIIRFADSGCHRDWKRKRNAQLQEWERIVTKKFAHWPLLTTFIAVFDF